MYYNGFQGKQLSGLGFGAMRLPLLADTPGTPVDEAQVERMVDYAIAHGVNYFDTAYPYHNGLSEIIIAKALSRYPREKYFLATKYPGHQISSAYDPEAIFEEQLRKCNVKYFDFYLLHNVYENSISTYLDPRWDILGYFREQKRLGRIRHLGFSSHGGIDCLRDFLHTCGDDMEFCQIQLNYLDWTLQDAKARYELLKERDIPVWVMEPVRGGRLAQLEKADVERLAALRPDEDPVAWAFRFLQGLPHVKMILSGMSDMQQMEANVKTFEDRKVLDEKELETLLDMAEGMKDPIPCTACRYCCDGCPQGLDIPMLLATYNDVRFSPEVNVGMRVEALPEDKRPSACVGCGKCSEICPQGIDVPKEMEQFSEALKKIPSWAEICRQRDAAQARR